MWNCGPICLTIHDNSSRWLEKETHIAIRDCRSNLKILSNRIWMFARLSNECLIEWLRVVGLFIYSASYSVQLKQNSCQGSQAILYNTIGVWQTFWPHDVLIRGESSLLCCALYSWSCNFYLQTHNLLRNLNLIFGMRIAWSEWL